MNFSGKDIHDHKQHDDNRNDFDGGFDRMRIKKIEHEWCAFISGCEGDAATVIALTVLGRK
ncbi:MAG TPA: hypothetical protein VEV15_11140 [Flavisolibacter sp.]|nr:hypothetical protein [Flavisolibacter sp.]